MLEEELDAKSVLDPLFGLGSQSSQPLGSQSSTLPDTTTGAAGPKTLLHFSETLPTIPPFDLALLGLPAPMSPITAGENALLSLVPGLPVKSSAPPGIGHGARELEEGVRPSLEINSVQTASMPLLAHRRIFLAIFLMCSCLI